MSRINASEDFLNDGLPFKKTNKVASYRKGARMERTCCTLLKTWTGHSFFRTPNSGGLGWGRSQAFVGDIVCAHGGFSFVVECKNVASVRLVRNDIKDNGTVQQWMQKTEEAAHTISKEPLLMIHVHKDPYDHTFIGVRGSVQQIIKKTHKIQHKKEGKDLYLYRYYNFVDIPYQEFNTKIKKLCHSSQINS